MDKLKYMNTFALIARTGSIIRAASLLGISKAAFSKQLIELERSMNTQLFHRTTRRLQLTETGKLFNETLKNVFSAVEEAEAVVSNVHAKPKGTLKIASHRHFGEKYIINHIAEFASLYPDLRLNIDLSDRFPDMEAEGIHVLCGVGHAGPEHLVRKKLMTVRRILCASPDYLSRFGTPKKPEDLKHHRYITHAFRRSDDMLEFINGNDIYVEYAYRVNDSQAMLKCALEGLGFLSIFDYFVEAHLKDGRMIEILKDYRSITQPLYVFYRQYKFLPLKIRVFVDFLCKKVEEGRLSIKNKI
jgi:DNA-binding transcriptional LysR family regulator